MNKFLRQIYSELPFLTHYVTNYYKIILGYNLNKFAPSIKKKKQCNYKYTSIIFLIFPR